MRAGTTGSGPQKGPSPSRPRKERRSVQWEAERHVRGRGGKRRAGRAGRAHREGGVPPRGSPAGAGRGCPVLSTDALSSPAPAPGVRLLQDQPKAQTQNHQGQSCASSGPSGHSSRWVGGGWRLCSRVAQWGPQGSCPGLWGEENWGGPVLRPPKAGSGNWVVEREECRGQPWLVGCFLVY